MVPWEKPVMYKKAPAEAGRGFLVEIGNSEQTAGKSRSSLLMAVNSL